MSLPKSVKKTEKNIVKYELLEESPQPPNESGTKTMRGSVRLIEADSDTEEVDLSRMRAALSRSHFDQKIAEWRQRKLQKEEETRRFSVSSEDSDDPSPTRLLKERDISPFRMFIEQTSMNPYFIAELIKDSEGTTKANMLIFIQYEINNGNIELYKKMKELHPAILRTIMPKMDSKNPRFKIMMYDLSKE